KLADPRSWGLLDRPLSRMITPPEVSPHENQKRRRRREHGGRSGRRRNRALRKRRPCSRLLGTLEILPAGRFSDRDFVGSHSAAHSLSHYHQPLYDEA